VPRGAIQFEFGLPQVEILDQGAVEATTVRIPVVALRYGLLERLELRAASPLYNQIDVQETEESGGGDVELGAKVHAITGGNGRPDLSLIGSVILPVGDESFTVSEDREAFAANAVAGGAIGERMSWIGVVGGTWLPDGDEGYTANANLVAYLGRSLSDRVSGYVEAEWFPSEGPSDPVLAGIGLAFLPIPTLQLDASVDRGLNDDALDWLFGVGVSVRFP
jgi:hypothetical protein